MLLSLYVVLTLLYTATKVVLAALSILFISFSFLRLQRRNARAKTIDPLAVSISGQEASSSPPPRNTACGRGLFLPPAATSFVCCAIFCDFRLGLSSDNSTDQAWHARLHSYSRLFLQQQACLPRQMRTRATLASESLSALCTMSLKSDSTAPPTIA